MKTTSKTKCILSRVKARLPLFAFIAFTGLSTGAAHAQTIIDDNFTGTAGGAPNATIWQQPPNFGSDVLTGPGVNLVADSSTLAQLIANQTSPYQVAPSAGTSVDESFTVNSVAGGDYFGLDNGSTNRILVTDTNPDGMWDVFITNAGVSTFTSTGIAAGSAGDGTWNIDWSTGLLTVSLNSTQVFSTTSGIPTGVMAPDFLATGIASGGVGANFTNVTLSEQSLAVPEPSTVMLLGLGAFLGLCYLRLKRLSSV